MTCSCGRPTWMDHMGNVRCSERGASVWPRGYVREDGCKETIGVCICPPISPQSWQETARRESLRVAP